METFADYILNEKDYSKKLGIMYFLDKKTDIFFNNSVILKTQLAKMFIEQKELDVDLLELFHYFKKRIEIILIVTAVFALAAFVVSSFFVVPEYTASTRVYILNRVNNQTLVSSDFSIANYMIKDYTILITGRNVTDKVVEKQKEICENSNQ